MSFNCRKLSRGFREVIIRVSLCTRDKTPDVSSSPRAVSVNPISMEEIKEELVRCGRQRELTEKGGGSPVFSHRKSFSTSQNMFFFPLKRNPFALGKKPFFGFWKAEQGSGRKRVPERNVVKRVNNLKA